MMMQSWANCGTESRDPGREQAGPRVSTPGISIYRGYRIVPLSRWGRRDPAEPRIVSEMSHGAKHTSNGAALYTEEQVREISVLASERKAAWRPDKA